MSEHEHQRLLEIESIVRKLFLSADADGLYLGAGKDGKKPDTRDAQQGPLVSRLRTLVAIDN